MIGTEILQHKNTSIASVKLEFNALIPEQLKDIEAECWLTLA